MSREKVIAIAWSTQTTRATEIAHALGGRGFQLSDLGLTSRALVPLRYAVNAVRTLSLLLLHRPQIVVVQNPPIFAPLIALAYTRAFGRTLVLDSHPVSFGMKQHRLWGAFLPVHRWIACRAAAVLVTMEELSAVVSSWGRQAVVVHEPPPALPTSVAHREEGSDADTRPQVLFIGVFAPDEPVAEVLDAARLLPEIAFAVTGRSDRADPALIAHAPSNVDFVGYLHQTEYTRALANATIVLTLTSERTSVLRSAYEAVYAHKPLITSDWPVLRELFPYALHVDNTGPAIASAVIAALSRLDELNQFASEALELQDERWKKQLRALEAALS